MGKVKGSGLVLVAVVIVGCGGGGSGPGGTSGGTCTLAMTGAKTATYDCAASLLDEGVSTGGPFISIIGSMGSFDFNINPVTTTTGAYMTGNKTILAKGSIGNSGADGGQEWDLSENDDPSFAPPLGSYSVQVTAISGAPVMVLTNAKQWQIEGVLDATYAPKASSAATGDVMIHVAFHDKSMF